VRKLLFSSLAALCLALGTLAATPSTAEAQVPRFSYSPFYVVSYHSSATDQWVIYGTYQRFLDAQWVSLQLKLLGYKSSVHSY
jgi:hypothetical protein